MIRYLLRDAVRRHKPVYLAAGGFLALMWLITVSGGIAPSGALALSLCHAWFLGVFAGVSLFASREIGLLPIPRRTLWRAQWMASTLVATCWTTAAKLVGAWVGALFAFQLPDLGFIALSACLDFLYNGVLLAVAAATGVAAGRMRENSSMISKAVQASGMFVALMGGFAWGFVLRIVVPTSWTQVTGATAMVMGAALLVTLAAFFYSPPTGEPHGQVRRGIRRRRDGVRSQKPGWLAGLPRLIADDLWSTAKTAILIPPSISAAFFGLYAFNPSPGAGTGPLKAMKEMGLLPMRDDASFAQCYFLLWMGLSLVNSWRSMSLLRQLRVMPLGVRQLNALLVGRRLLGWLVVWLFLLIPHGVVFQSAPSTLRLDILAWVAGADALVYALLLRWMKWWPIVVFSLGFAIVSGRWIDAQSAGFAPLYGVAVGLACLAAAVCINHVTLTSRQELYRGMPPPLIAKPFGIRG